MGRIGRLPLEVFMKSAVPAVLVLVLAASIAAAGEFPVTVHERTLDNGLKVLVLPRKGVPTSPLAIAYDVGSVHERPGRTGLAHYLEHMMFKGTKKTGVKDLAIDARLRAKLDEVIAETIRLEDGPATPEALARIAELKAERDRLIGEQKANTEINHLFKIYREAGSTFTNAMTSNDRTIYIAALPPEKIELFFWVEADRLRDIVFRQFHAEKDVVREERRMYENRPGAHFNEAIDRAFFGPHPYSHGVLGSHDDLRRLTRTELREFWSRYYSVDNATIFVGGDVDPERVFALAERYFGAMKPSTAKRPRIPT
ncbi:MAG: pitrilysin family protein, partial [Planctomycetota bacterium]